MKTRRIAFLGLMVALAFVLSYVEMLLPIHIGIPGAKIGLANLSVMVALYVIGPTDALILSIVRVVLVGFTFGNMAMMMYSLAGALLSFVAMMIGKRTKLFSAVGVSVLGGVFHNVGQILVAMVVMETSRLTYYLPFLVVMGVISGIIIGIVAGMIVQRVAPFGKNR
ncbi:MAG: Gx transporter family protein [Lachnospiraceae bacterium]|nr:Gx transporter family protein [Lachnospiraceae bacterium]